jgi:hypothetical protein
MICQIIQDPKQVRNWLKGRNLTNLRICSGVFRRITGFADISTSEYILCSLSCLKNKSLYKLYTKISKVPIGDGMLYDWLHIITV